VEPSGTPSRPAAAAPADDAGVPAGAGKVSASGSGGPSAPTATATPSSSTSAPTKPAARPATKPATKPAAKQSAKPASEVASTGPVRVAPGAAAELAPVAVPPAPARPAASEPMTPVAPRVPPVATPAPATRPSGPRRARLLVSRLDPWSVMKTAFMLSISVAIVLLMATALLWWTLSVTGVFSAIGRTVNDIAGTSTTSFDFLSLVSFSRVMGVALVLAAVEVVLMSALTTLFAFLYNLSVGLTGGLEVTLSEDA
jgi:hypothetical protein